MRYGYEEHWLEREVRQARQLEPTNDLGRMQYGVAKARRLAAHTHLYASAIRDFSEGAYRSQYAPSKESVYSTFASVLESIHGFVDKAKEEKEHDPEIVEALQLIHSSLDRIPRKQMIERIMAERTGKPYRLVDAISKLNRVLGRKKPDIFMQQTVTAEKGKPVPKPVSLETGLEEEMRITRAAESSGRSHYGPDPFAEMKSMPFGSAKARRMAAHAVLQTRNVVGRLHWNLVDFVRFVDEFAVKELKTSAIRGEITPEIRRHLLTVIQALERVPKSLELTRQIDFGSGTPYTIAGAVKKMRTALEIEPVSGRKTETSNATPGKPDWLAEEISSARKMRRVPAEIKRNADSIRDPIQKAKYLAAQMHVEANLPKPDLQRCVSLASSINRFLDTHGDKVDEEVDVRRALIRAKDELARIKGIVDGSKAVSWGPVEKHSQLVDAIERLRGIR